MKINLQSVTWLSLCLSVTVGGVTLLLALMVVAGALFVFIRRYGRPIDGLILLFLAVSVISLFRGNPPIGILVVLLSVMLAAHLSKIISKQCISENLLCLCMLVGSLPLSGSGWRYSGIFENPNMFASFVCANMALFFILGLPAKMKISLVFLVCCICIFLSGSRAWAVLAAFFTLVILTRSFQGLGKAMFIKLLLVIFSLIMIYMVPWAQLVETYLSVFTERFSALSQGGDGSTMARLKNLDIAVEALIERPLFGDGISGFYVLSGNLYHSHSTILELLVSFGLVIGSVLVLCLFSVVVELVLKPRNYGLQRLEGMGIASYLLLFLFFDSILSNVLALTVLFSLLALSPRWGGLMKRSVFSARKSLGKHSTGAA